MWMAPLFLLGLAGVALPLWLHRFARQTDEKQPFASLMFLEASTVRRSRRQELRYRPLLALRLLLVALAALAFAGPLWRLAAAPGPAGGATLHVIALDTSLSMQRGSTWQRAQQEAQGIIAALRGGDRAMVVAADHRLRVMQEPVFAEQRGLLSAAVEGLAPGASRLDYGTLMTGSAAWGAAPGEQVRLHLITDLQASASPLRFADLQPPAGVTLDLRDAGGDESPNLRVAGVEVPERDASAALVRIEGDAAALAGRELVFEINGVERGRRMLRAGPLPQTERFDIGDPGAGEHRLGARLQPADALPQDDARYALLRRVQPRVLLIAATTSADDATYLRAALESLANPRFQVEVAGAPQLITRSLQDFSAIVVSDAGVLDAGAAAALRRYVEGGGAALLTLGPRALQADGEPLTGAQLAAGRARAAGNQMASVAEVEQSHPVLRDSAGWRSIRFLRHVPIVPPQGARVLMQFGNGSPLLLEQTLGRGRVLTFASPLAREWNDLAIHPLFVRFVAESAMYLAGTQAEAITATVGGPVDADLGGRGGQVFDPAGERALMLQGTAGSLRFVPAQPGFYEVRGGGRSDYIAVNPDPRESRLERLERAVVERWLALKAAAAPAGGQTAAVARAAQPDAGRLIPVWFWLLLGAALLALFEPLVANYHLYVLRERRE
ncbi:MAG: BatA domain-containing protein [Steroidobacteraceae bacterium]